MGQEQGPGGEMVNFGVKGVPGPQALQDQVPRQAKLLG